MNHQDTNNNPHYPNRRRFLGACATWCAGFAAMWFPVSAFGCANKKQCKPTEDNIEGPYYRGGAPWKTHLVPKGEGGVPLEISGVVYAADCKTPLANCLVDVWHADAKGSYDNDGVDDPPKQTTKYRGRMRTNAKGEYRYTTVVPGRYLNGPTYRPSHIHYKVEAKGHEPLTTQLYFAGDPYIKGDAFVRASLVISLYSHGKGKKGVFNIVLAKKQSH